MLSTLRIKNLALVDDLTLDLREGYNVITGETGAGKSIILGALKLVLGERADRTLLRSGCDSCTVEAVFDVTRLNRVLPVLLEENGLECCEEDQLVLRRVLTVAGANRQFVNGSPTTLGTLASVGELLVDMHGPHDHQSLLHPARQLEILDAHGGLGKERDAFALLVGEHGEALRRKSALVLDDSTHAQQMDLLRFQVREITAAQLDPGEEEKVEEELRRVGNAARLLELGHAAIDQMVEGEVSILAQAGPITQQLQGLSRLDPGTAPLLQQHQQAVEAVTEIARSLSSYLDTIEVDPGRLQELEERLNLIQSLKRKYGSTLADVIGFGEQAKVKLGSLEQRDAELADLNREIARIEADLRDAGKSLSDRRRKVIPKLCKEVERELRDLGFESSHLEIALNSDIPAGDQALGQLSPSGFDTGAFLFAPNPGEPARPLRAIASSGELARVMLALKTVLAVEDQIPVLVFDEVDANVGGETAHAVGRKMQQIAARRQVLCITHLPQVAAPAATHYLVTKELADGRTLSRIAPVSGRDRVHEFARMLGGGGDAALKHARAILSGNSV